MSRLHKSVVGLSALALVGCETSPGRNAILPTAPTNDEVTAIQDAALSPWAAQVVDSTADGAAYAMFVPNNWDRTGRRLVVFAQGLVYPSFPVALPNINSVRDLLGAKGFAVAYSSYGENGWVVKVGGERTHQLSGLFAARFGKPGRTFLYGRSLGGLIAIMLAEKYPEQYDGVLAECPVVEGSTIAFRYLFDVRRLFDYFYPGILPGNALGVPPEWTPSPSDADRVGAAMDRDTTVALAMAKTDQVPIQFARYSEFRAGMIDLLTVHAFEVNDILQRSHGGPPVSSSMFTSSDPSLPLDAINATTLHYDAAPDAANFAAHEYDPSGKLHIPVLMLTTSRDPRLPPSLNELVYQQRVIDAAGSSAMLQRRQVPAFGHCAFKAADRANALLDVVAWVETGVRPTP